MYQTTLGSRSFFIEDKEMVSRINNSNLSFDIFKEVNGDVVVVVSRCESGMKVFNGRRARVNIPSVLKKYQGKQVSVYVERVKPVNGEVFRVRPVDFKFIGIKSRKVLVDPYLTDKELIIPQHYCNSYMNKNFCKGSCVSLNRTTNDSLRDGYVIAYITEADKGKAYVDEYRLRESGSSLRTTTMTTTMDFLGRNKKSLKNYRYKGTMRDPSTGFYMMFFKEEAGSESKSS